MRIVNQLAAWTVLALMAAAPTWADELASEGPAVGEVVTLPAPEVATPDLPAPSVSVPETSAPVEPAHPIGTYVGPRAQVGYAATLPAARGCRTRRQHVPAPKRARLVELRHDSLTPVWKNKKVPHYRVKETPVYAWREKQEYTTQRTPRYEMVPVTIYEWRQVPNYVERKHEIWEEEERPRLVSKDVKRETVTLEPTYAYGEERTPAKARGACDRCQPEQTAPPVRRTKRLTGFQERHGRHTADPTWQYQGTVRRKVFKGIRTERVLAGTKRERVAVGTRMERRLVGYDTRRIPCGTTRERVQVNTRREKEIVGCLTDRVKIDTREDSEVYDWQCTEESCGRPGTRLVREPTCAPAVRVTVVPDGTVGAAPLPGTTGVMTESQYRGELSRRASGLSR